MQLAVLLALLGGCGSEPHRGRTPESDAGLDAEDDDAGIDPDDPAAPAPPGLTPCPAGWREVPDADFPEVVTCDPWPGDGPEDCVADEAHFPGGAGCERIGTPCPAGDFPEDLPAGATVRHVLAGAPAGGSGSAASPFSTISSAIVAARNGDVVAIGKGTYDEFVRVTEDLTLRGACVAETTIARSVPDGNVVTLAIEGGGGASIENLRVSGVRPGIYVAATPGPVELSDVVVDDTSLTGVTIEAGSVVVARSFVVRGTREDGRFTGQGILVRAGATLTLDRAALVANHTAALGASQPDTVLVATDVAVVDTVQSVDARQGGFGIGFVDGATGTLLRVAIERNQGGGLFSLLENAHVDAEHLVIRDTEAHDFLGGGGAAIGVGLGATATVRKAWFARNTAGSIGVFQGSSLVAEDLVVVDTQSDAQLAYLGIGLGAEQADVTLTRAAFHRNRLASIMVGEEGMAFVATDLAIRETIEQEVDSDYGYGMQIGYGATADIRRALVSGSRRGGIVVAQPGTVVTFEDLAIADTFERACLPDCPREAGGGGTGLASLDGATVDITRFRVAQSALCGVQLTGSSGLDLHEGEVTGNVVGANVQTESFDLFRLQDRVVYRENERDLDAASLPVPTPVGGI